MYAGVLCYLVNLGNLSITGNSHCKTKPISATHPSLRRGTAVDSARTRSSCPAPRSACKAKGFARRRPFF